jgi:membrane-associated protease RseP (regulator of RpoE activity)
MPDPLFPSSAGRPSADAGGARPGFYGERRAAEDRDDNGFDRGDELEPAGDYDRGWVAVARPRSRDRVWLHALLFGITILTTTLVGVDHWLNFRSQFGMVPLGRLLARMTWQQLIPSGFWYGGTIVLILGAHELGHYLACRYYRIDASLPYFLPLPPFLFLTGTLGAFIRIRQPITTKRMLFDIGIAGPLAGFVFAVPALVIGLAMSTVARVPPHMPGGMELGEPLLFKAASWAIWGAIPDGYSVNMHPMAFAAWFGLLATVLNLFPIGQLDGGHIAYTVLGRRSATLTRVMVVVVIALTFVSWSWLLWSLLLVGMLFAFGVHHPPTLDEHVPLDRARKVLVVVALAIFVLCFMPAPIQPLDLIRK